MWAVHSDPERCGSWTPNGFFATGEPEIAAMWPALELHGLLPRSGRAVVFGCGVGRLTRISVGAAAADRRTGPTWRRA
jgi:hypothetical protein